MGSTFDKLLSKNLLNTPPAFLKNNTHYECITGSIAYGCNEKETSDYDIYAIAIPPKDVIFPHLKGYIPGFDNPEVFHQFQQHHIIDKSERKEYDITVFNIVQFFRLCIDGNPNIVDALHVPRSCVLFSTQIGEHIRDNANIFLSKKCFYKFNGYAASQLHKMKTKEINTFITFCDTLDISYHTTLDEATNLNLSNTDKERLIKLIKIIDKEGKRTKRIETIAKYGIDVKFAYHVIRLLLECEQILTTHTLVLNRDREIYKAIRRGEWDKEKVISFFEDNEKCLRKMYDESTLRNAPDVNAVRQLLLNCLEMHYGSLEQCVANLNKHEQAIREIRQILNNHKL